MNRADISLQSIIWLSTGIVLAGLPHWERLPFWIPIIHLILIGLRIYLPWKQPGVWYNQQTFINIIRLLVMVGGVIGIYIVYGTFAGRDVGITLLVMLSALKIFESRRERDFYISAYLGYFLVITNFFYEQTIPTAIYMFVVVIVMTSSLIHYNDKDGELILMKKLRTSSMMLLQSLPILLILFVLFPRIDGPLWGLPEDALSSVTGIDDTIEPGSISRLVRSSEIAFRVKFEGDIPNPTSLYWRGPVLWQTNGRIWTRGSRYQQDITPGLRFSGEPTYYNLMQEPTNKKWIFALEMNSTIPDKSYRTFDMQLRAREKLQIRQSYDLVAYRDYELREPSNDNLLRALALPEQFHVETRELANQIRDQHIEPKQIIEATLDWFKTQGFIYTLQPPLSRGDSVDDFLFNSKQGFCEHYAAAFTVLMRSAGIPARIVAGYQGGEVNTLGNYLVVRQHHAHAWTEVWLEDEGWIRIDPTKVVSPTRIDQGIEQALPESISTIPAGIKNSSILSEAWQRISNSIDMVNYQWAQWVLGYGEERQQLLMQLLGLGLLDWKDLTLILFSTLFITFIIITIYVLSQRPKTSDPVKRLYERFCKKLAKIGIVKPAHEGPEDFLKRIKKHRSSLYDRAGNVIRLYIDVRYRSDNARLDEFKLAVKEFKTT